MRLDEAINMFSPTLSDIHRPIMSKESIMVWTHRGLTVAGRFSCSSILQSGAKRRVADTKVDTHSTLHSPVTTQLQRMMP